MPRSLAIFALIFSACTPQGAQEAYQYPGCEDAGTYLCPNDRVFECAMARIAAKHDQCEVAEDCVDATLSNCMGWAVCTGTAVNAASRAEYVEEASAEISRYCADAGCSGGPSCAGAPDRIECANGRCLWRQDAGT